MAAPVGALLSSRTSHLHRPGPPNLGWGPHMCRKDPLAGRVGRNSLRALAPLGPEAGERETNAGPEAYGPRLGCNQPCHTNPPLGTQPRGTVGSGVQPSTLLLLQGGCLRNFRLERIQHLQRAMSWTYGCGSLDTSLFYERTWHECGAPGRASSGGMHDCGQRPNDLRHKHLHRTRRTLP